MEVFLDGRSPATVACGNISEILAGSSIETRELHPKGPPKTPVEVTTQLCFITNEVRMFHLYANLFSFACLQCLIKEAAAPATENCLQVK